MKKFLLWLLTLIITLPAVARDFSYSYKGQTLIYTVIDEEAKTCKTKDGFMIEGDFYAGNNVYRTLEIPASVSDGISDFMVTSIGDYGFYNCTRLESVTIPNSVHSIGYNAFSHCIGFVSVSIPNSVISIDAYAFSYCTGLKSVTIPNSVSYIGKNAFLYCSSLTSITIPNSVCSIEDWTFYGCASLTSVNIPNSVKSIGNYAFSGCYDLTSVTIPNSVSSIGGWAFDSCSSLTSITIPNSVSSIKDWTFYLCEGLTSINIPNSVTSIGDHVFCGCKNLSSVNIPNSVSSIGGSAFEGCISLTSLNIPNSVSSIGRRAFYGCKKLTSITIPTSVSSIEEYTFSNCEGLTSIIIPNSVSTINKYAFYECSNLESVTLPNSVSSIGDKTFDHCFHLTKIHCFAIKPPVCEFGTFYSGYSGYGPISCMLFVHKNSVEAYRNAYRWKDFTTILGYYVPGGENESLYIQNFFIEPGEVAYMPVRLRGERDYSDFATDVYLPDGLETVTAEDGTADVQFAREDGNHTLSVATQPDGAVRVAVKSVDNAPIASNGSDVLFYIRVKANNDIASGPVPVWMRNTSFKDANYEYLFNDANPHINADGVMGGVDVEVSTEAVYYNLQGVRVAQPVRGQIYICVQGGKARKLVF